MNILHVLSQVFASGSEFYATAVADQHLDKGHRVFIVSDTLTAGTCASYSPAPISKRRPLQRLNNILFLKNFIREHKIDIVHAHSRAASWVSYFAVLNTSVPLISTIHGRQHLHASTKIFDMYGDAVIAICENVKTHLIEEVGMRAEKITVLPNGIDFESLTPRTLQAKNESFILSVVGRTNDQKGQKTAQLIKRIFPDLLARYPQLRIQIIGGKPENMGRDAVGEIARLNKVYAFRISAPGFTNDLPASLSASDLVICSGRVALESLWLERPTMALGESSYEGMVSIHNLPQAMASNFGDISPGIHKPDIDYNLIKNDIFNVLENKYSKVTLRQEIQSAYNITKVSEGVMNIYRSARMKKKIKKFIPILMYHKIPDNEIDSPNKIFVTKSNFENHLKFFQSKKFTAITFKDYEAYSLEKKPLNEFPKRPLMFTFDDGYEDNYTNLLPLMNKYGFKGIIYLLGDPKVDYNFWDADQGDHFDRLMTTEQKRAFVSAGWEIGAHSMTHADLTKCNDQQLKIEIFESKNNLERLFATQIISFAYPRGILNERVKKMTEEAQIRYGIATDSGGMHIEDDRLQIFRINIFPHETNFSLTKKTSSWYRIYYRWKRKK